MQGGAIEGCESNSGLSGGDTPSRKEEYIHRSRDNSLLAQQNIDLPEKSHKRMSCEDRIEAERKQDDDDELSDDFSGKFQEHGNYKESSTSRSSRGLRVLSVRVRELVSEKRTTTYKEVADMLIKELIEEGKMPKDSHNVRKQKMIII